MLDSEHRRRQINGCLGLCAHGGGRGKSRPNSHQKPCVCKWRLHKDTDAPRCGSGCSPSSFNIWRLWGQGKRDPAQRRKNEKSLSAVFIAMLTVNMIRADSRIGGETYVACPCEIENRSHAPLRKSFHLGSGVCCTRARVHAQQRPDAKCDRSCDVRLRFLPTSANRLKCLPVTIGGRIMHLSKKFNSQKRGSGGFCLQFSEWQWGGLGAQIVLPGLLCDGAEGDVPPLPFLWPVAKRLANLDLRHSQ